MSTLRRLSQVVLASMFLALLIGCSGSSDSGTETGTAPTAADVGTTNASGEVAVDPAVATTVQNLGNLGLINTTLVTTAATGSISQAAAQAINAAILKGFSGIYIVRWYPDPRLPEVNSEGSRMRINEDGSVSLSLVPLRPNDPVEIKADGRLTGFITLDGKIRVTGKTTTNSPMLGVGTLNSTNKSLSNGQVFVSGQSLKWRIVPGDS